MLQMHLDQLFSFHFTYVGINVFKISEIDQRHWGAKVVGCCNHYMQTFCIGVADILHDKLPKDTKLLCVGVLSIINKQPSVL